MLHNHSQFCNADYENSQVDLSFLSQPDAGSIEITKPRRKPQRAAERFERLRIVQEARSLAAHAEADAGPTLRREIDAEKVIERACDGAQLRHDMTLRLLMMRAGLFKLCNTESTSHDFDCPTERVRLYFDVMLMISANVAAITGSTWPAIWGWFCDRLPVPSERIGRHEMEARFNILVAESTAKIASRPTLRVWDLSTIPTPMEIAEIFGTTDAQLRAAKATKCRLTAIDAKSKKDRDREAQATKRRAAGMAKQTDRTVQARDLEISLIVGCSQIHIRKLRTGGRLAEFLVRKGHGDLPEAVSYGDRSRSIRNNRASKDYMQRHFQILLTGARTTRAPRSTATRLYPVNSRTRLAA